MVAFKKLVFANDFINCPHPVCPDKETRYPITGFNPIHWIKTDHADFIVAGIDGFIVTNKNKVNGIFKSLNI